MRFCIFFSILLFSSQLIAEQSNDYSEQCYIDGDKKPIATWDFNKHRKFPLRDGVVEFEHRHGGIVEIPNSSFYGIRFHYEKKWPDGDAMAELRYKIIEPQNHVFEHIKIYQPKNFYHRLIVEVKPDRMLNMSEWNYGDVVVTNKGDSGKVAKAFENKLFIMEPTGIHKKSWGENTLVKNASNEAGFTSTTSRFYASNNKLSAMWQGKYSNAAMVVETRARSLKANGDHGNGYCSPKGSRSPVHGPFGERHNFISLDGPATCFDVIDNGTIVELVIERKRSTNLENPDGIYRIWKRTVSKPWSLIFENLEVPAYQPEKNYFDNGYIFGWSNSGYREDTDFYLTGWSLWNTKPSFLP